MIDNDSVASDPDFSSSQVPLNSRMSRGSLTMAWWALCSAMFWLVVTATLAINYGARNAIIGLVLSVITYGIINSVISRYAIRTGLSVGIFSRIVYGNVGEILATAIFFLTAIYYCIFEGSVIAIAIQSYFPSLTLWQAYLIVVCYSVPLVFGGVSLLLDKLNGVLLPFYILGLFGAVGAALYQYGYSDAWLSLGPQGEVTDKRWWSCYTYFMGIWIMMMYTWDYARFGKPGDEKYHSKFNFGMPFYLFTFLINGLIGIFLAATIPTEGGVSETSIVFAILKLMGIWGLLFIWISQTRINTANFQLSTVNMQAFITSVTDKVVPKIVVAIVVGVVVYALMLTDVFSFILQALAYQGIFVVAWVAIALAHIYLTRHENHAQLQYSKQHLPGVKKGALTAWIAASIVGVVLLNITPAYASFSAPVTALVAVTAYLLSWNRKQQASSVPSTVLESE